MSQGSHNDSLKCSLTQALDATIPHTIAAQGKDILICEIVRMLVDESTKLGFLLSPSPRDAEGYRNRKSCLVRALQEKYAQYKGSHASIKNIVSDLIDEAAKIGVSIVSSRLVSQD